MVDQTQSPYLLAIREGQKLVLKCLKSDHFVSGAESSNINSKTDHMKRENDRETEYKTAPDSGTSHDKMGERISRNDVSEHDTDVPDLSDDIKSY